MGDGSLTNTVDVVTENVTKDDVVVVPDPRYDGVEEEVPGRRDLVDVLEDLVTVDVVNEEAPVVVDLGGKVQGTTS